MPFVWTKREEALLVNITCCCCNCNCDSCCCSSVSHKYCHYFQVAAFELPQLESCNIKWHNQKKQQHSADDRWWPMNLSLCSARLFVNLITMMAHFLSSTLLVTTFYSSNCGWNWAKLCIMDGRENILQLSCERGDISLSNLAGPTSPP